MTDEELQTFYKGKQVVVTGAAGFIGSHLTEALVRMGARVRVLCRYTSSGTLGKLEELPGDERGALEVVYGNVEDSSCVLTLCRDAEVVFHLAALIGIPYSYVAPRQYVATNVEGTVNLLEAVRALGVRKLVHTSTSETYGTNETYGGPETSTMAESHPLVAQSPYSASKIAADKFAESYYLSFGTPVATIRPFNTFGPRQSPRAVIPTIAKQLAAGATELRLGSVEPVRDFNFVTDTVAGFLRIGASDESVGKVLNVASGRAVSVGEVVRMLCALSGRDVSILTESARVRPERSEVMYLLGDFSRARDLVGYEPRVALEEGLRRTYAYFQAQRAADDGARYAV